LTDTETVTMERSESLTGSLSRAILSLRSPAVPPRLLPGQLGYNPAAATNPYFYSPTLYALAISAGEPYAGRSLMFNLVGGTFNQSTPFDSLSLNPQLAPVFTSLYLDLWSPLSVNVTGTVLFVGFGPTANYVTTATEVVTLQFSPRCFANQWV